MNSPAIQIYRPEDTNLRCKKHIYYRGVMKPKAPKCETCQRIWRIRNGDESLPVEELKYAEYTDPEYRETVRKLDAYLAGKNVFILE